MVSNDKVVASWYEQGGKKKKATCKQEDGPRTNRASEISKRNSTYTIELRSSLTVHIGKRESKCDGALCQESMQQLRSERASTKWNFTKKEEAVTH